MRQRQWLCKQHIVRTKRAHHRAQRPATVQPRPVLRAHMVRMRVDDARALWLVLETRRRRGGPGAQKYTGVERRGRSTQTASTMCLSELPYFVDWYYTVQRHGSRHRE